MITLTKSVQVSSTIGSDNALVPYDRIVLQQININPVDQLINGTVRLTASGSPEMPPIVGDLRISVPEAKLRVEVSHVGRKSMSLTSSQNTAALKVMTDAQNALEAGLINLGVINGVQAPGV